MLRVRSGGGPGAGPCRRVRSEPHSFGGECHQPGGRFRWRTRLRSHPNNVSRHWRRLRPRDGKGTIGKALRDRFPSLRWSVSWATRPPRPGEREGVDYHFCTPEEFQRLRDAGGFLESFDVYGDLKGTPRGPIEAWLAAGDDA